MAQAVSRRSIVYDILFDVEQGRASARDAERALSNLDRQVESTGSGFANLGKQIAAAFALQEVIRNVTQFAQEAFELGLKAEGVRKAFTALNNPNLLNNLRAATRGTVDDLTLMQAAVRADKFKIPLERLGGLFKFAATRARETGQEVGFLVSSIIDGIGRKSPLILDNLGLRAQDLQDEFKKTGDFAQAAANVISKEMDASGEHIEGNAEKVERLRISWQNFKLSVGEALVSTIDDIQSLGETITKSLSAAIPTIFGTMQAATKHAESFRIEQEKNNEAALAGTAIFQKLASQGLDFTALSLADINEKLKELNDAFASESRPRFREELAKQIIALEATKKAIEDLLKPMEKLIRDLEGVTPLLKFEPTAIPNAMQPTIETIAKLETELSGLQELFENTFTGSPEFEELKKLIEELEARIASLRGETEKTGEKFKSVFSEDLSKSLQSIGSIFGNLSQLAKDSSGTQIALSIANIFAANAEALANAIASAAKITFPGNIPAILSSVAIITGMFAQVKGLISQAQAAQASVQAFAEGEVDIHRQGETRGKDSIPAMLMPGETVLTSDKTRRYKPMIQAIHEGTLDDLIKVNYVEPALALQALENSKTDSTEIDYSDKFYRQYLATGEGNVNGRRMLNVLASIDRKLTDRKQKPRN